MTYSRYWINSYPPGVPADIDGSGVVDAGDLSVVLANWTG